MLSLYTPHKELALAFLIWGSQSPKLLGPVLLRGVIQDAHYREKKNQKQKTWNMLPKIFSRIGACNHNPGETETGGFV